MKIAIVNDLVLAAEALRRFVATLPGDTLAWIANDGLQAVQKCAENPPDVILMDLLMPRMDGVEATRQIMTRYPCAILIVTATIQGNSAMVIEALGAGALDAAPTPTFSPDGTLDKAQTLRLKLDAVRQLASERRAVSETHRIAKSPVMTQPLVVLGASAGGPSALAAILSRLPSSFRAPIVIVQHIDAEFAPSMASWLADQCAIPVRAALHGEHLLPGAVLVAATNDHLVLLDGQRIGYAREPAQCLYRPSIDVFFESVARHWRGNIVAALLTGMGRDGAKGLKALRDAGSLTIAQDAQSCVVYGMPKAAVDLGAVCETLPLERIAARIAFAISLTTGNAAGRVPVSAPERH